MAAKLSKAQVAALDAAARAADLFKGGMLIEGDGEYAAPAATLDALAGKGLLAKSRARGRDEYRITADGRAAIDDFEVEADEPAKPARSRSRSRKTTGPAKKVTEPVEKAPEEPADEE